jgi:hypothetical protein
MGYSIQDQTIWVNGELKNANYLVVSIFSDNLKDSAIFYWQLQYVTTDADGITDYQNLVNGNLPIFGNDYTIWGETTDVNYAAYQFVASQLNLQLV